MADRRDIWALEATPVRVGVAVVIIDMADLFVRSTAFLTTVDPYVRSPMVSSARF
jgi:hypothetical protein